MHRVLLALSRDMSGISRLPAVLARHGIHVTVLTAPGHLLALARRSSARVPCAPGEVATADALLRHLGSGSAAYDLVILGDDPLLERIARLDGASHLLPCPSNADLAWSKHAFATLCSEEDLPSPATYAVSTAEEARATASRIGYPLILKSATGFAGSGVHRCNDAEQLDRHLGHLGGEQPWLMQQFVEGRVGTVDVLFWQGRPVAWTSALVTSTCDGPFSSSTSRRFHLLAGLEPLLHRIGRRSGLHGFAGLDFILRHDGTPALLEMNCRPTIGHSLGAGAGVDFGRVLAGLLAGRAEESPTQRPDDGRVIRFFPEDFGRCIGERDYRGALAWLLLPSRWRLLPWREPGMFLRQVCDIITRIWRRFTALTIKRPHESR
jgi:glutathione synthase/RimK-type ligase-like ATP-grasp enzyme